MRCRLLGVVLLVVLAGCGGPVSGEPVAGAPVSTGPPSTSVTGRVGDGLNMSDFDPCTAIKKDQASDLGLDGPKSGISSQGTKSCTWSHFKAEPIESYYVDSSDSLGIDSINGVGQSFNVGRYKAVIGRSQSASFESTCGIFIDVHPGQVLQVNYAYDGSTQRMTHDLACQKAKPVAAMVIANLDRGGN